MNSIKPMGKAGLLATLSATAALAAVVAILLPRAGVTPPGRLRVEPELADLSDRISKEAEPVSSNFRLVNPSESTVTVTSFGTSCSCTTTLFDERKQPPFELGAGEAVEFTLQAHPIPRAELIQDYHVYIAMECGGRELPDLIATLRVKVDDPPKANPPLLSRASLPADKPYEHQIELVTMSPETPLSKPEIVVSGDPAIQARLVEGDPGDHESHGYAVRYTIAVAVTPGPDAAPVTGTISIRPPGGSDILVPVRCSFQKPFRLSEQAINVNGSPGSTVERQLFFEANQPGWTDLVVASRPDNIECEIEPFDAVTRVARVRIHIPPRDPGGAEIDDQSLIFEVRGHDSKITIPVRYSEDGSPEGP